MGCAIALSRVADDVAACRPASRSAGSMMLPLLEMKAMLDRAVVDELEALVQRDLDAVVDGGALADRPTRRGSARSRRRSPSRPGRVGAVRRGGVSGRPPTRESLDAVAAPRCVVLALALVVVEGAAVEQPVDAGALAGRSPALAVPSRLVHCTVAMLSMLGMFSAPRGRPCPMTRSDDAAALGDVDVGAGRGAQLAADDLEVRRRRCWWRRPHRSR